MTKRRRDPEERILMVLPVGRDAELASRILEQARFCPEVCPDLAELSRRLEEGTGAVLVSEEALQSTLSLGRLAQTLNDQPAWSAVPIIVATSGRAASRASLDALRWLSSA